jgi:hypothetical protein
MGWRIQQRHEELLRHRRGNDDRIHWRRVGIVEGRIVVVFLVPLLRLKKYLPPRRMFRDLELWAWRWSIVDR